MVQLLPQKSRFLFKIYTFIIYCRLIHIRLELEPKIRCDRICFKIPFFLNLILIIPLDVILERRVFALFLYLQAKTRTMNLKMRKSSTADLLW